MTSEVERNKALIRAHYEATVNHFDPALIEEQVADDFFDHAAGTRLGPDGVKQHIQALKAVFPDLHVTLEDLIAEGDKVAVRACWRGTHKRGIPRGPALAQAGGVHRDGGLARGGRPDTRALGRGGHPGAAARGRARRR